MNEENLKNIINEREIFASDPKKPLDFCGESIGDYSEIVSAITTEKTNSEVILRYEDLEKRIPLEFASVPEISREIEFFIIRIHALSLDWKTMISEILGGIDSESMPNDLEWNYENGTLEMSSGENFVELNVISEGPNGIKYNIQNIISSWI